jgi:hypothetical protein
MFFPSEARVLSSYQVNPWSLVFRILRSFVFFFAFSGAFSCILPVY